jgi:hypothetical protein
MTASSAAEPFPRVPIWPRVPRYGRGRFDEAFDTAAILRLASEIGGLPDGHVLYLVDFASRRRPGVDEAELTRLDHAAHAEAAASRGFLLYFRGDVDRWGYCRSFCVWRSMRDGMEAARKPRHRAAEDATHTMYSSYVVTMREVWLTDEAPGFAVGLTRTYGSDETSRA